VDADIVVYQACAAVEREMDWGDDMWTLHSDAREAREIVDITLAEIKDATKASKITLCFTSSNNWRMGVLPDYKANRAASRKPVCYRAVKDYCLSAYPCVSYPRLEADDVIGLLATRPKTKGTVIVSEDKDFKGVPGKLYNPRTRTFTKTTKSEATRFHLYQTLVGDTTDNYKGCPGIGPVKADAILDADCSWPAVTAAFVKAGLTEDHALQQARVARILQHGEYNLTNAEVTLWTP
jgi:DNA polymerase-1